MPSVIHTLHQALGHPTVSSTLQNFQHYYYHHKAKPLITDYVQACLTCKYAHIQDLKKSVPSAERIRQPTRPRQHLYCDLIPMPKGQYSYILFCLDAYSQYVYALPLKDKSAPSVLQGFLSLFATTG
jgi:Integrase zinc binding domain